MTLGRTAGLLLTSPSVGSGIEGVPHVTVAHPRPQFGPRTPISPNPNASQTSLESLSPHSSHHEYTYSGHPHAYGVPKPIFWRLFLSILFCGCICSPFEPAAKLDHPSPQSRCQDSPMYEDEVNPPA